MMKVWTNECLDPSLHLPPHSVVTGQISQIGLRLRAHACMDYEFGVRGLGGEI